MVSVLNSNLIVIGSFTSGTITVEAGYTTSGTINVTKDGYVPFGIVGWNISNSSDGSNMGGCFLVRNYISNNTANYFIRNVNTGEANITLTIYVLYKKG